MPDKNEIKAQELYDLKLHECIDYNDLFLTVVRVPGGWLYKHNNYSPPCMVFVPWHNEFQPK